MTQEQIIKYIELKLQLLNRQKEQLLDRMLEQKPYESEDLYRDEYLKTLYAYDQILEIKTFIKTGVDISYEHKKES